MHIKLWIAIFILVILPEAEQAKRGRKSKTTKSSQNSIKTTRPPLSSIRTTKTPSKNSVKTTRPPLSSKKTTKTSPQSSAMPFESGRAKGFSIRTYEGKKLMIVQTPLIPMLQNDIKYFWGSVFFYSMQNSQLNMCSMPFDASNPAWKDIYLKVKTIIENWDANDPAINRIYNVKVEEMAMNASDPLQGEFVTHSQQYIDGRLARVTEIFRRPKLLTWGCKLLAVCCGSECCDPNLNTDVQEEMETTITSSHNTDNIDVQEEIQTTIASSQSIEVQEEIETTTTSRQNTNVQEEVQTTVSSNDIKDYQMVKQINISSNQTTDFFKDIETSIDSYWIALGAGALLLLFVSCFVCCCFAIRIKARRRDKQHKFMHETAVATTSDEQNGVYFNSNGASDKQETVAFL